MIDITHKSNTLRIATAEAIVELGSTATMERVVNKSVPKGDVLEMAKTAGLFGVKQTSSIIPDCHPLPIEGTSITYELKEQSIYILVEVKTIYKTGVEVEAMHGASVVALTIYDMLKPIDKNIEIKSIRLLSKSGGKSDIPKRDGSNYSCAIINCSNAIARGDKAAKAGENGQKQLEKHGLSDIQQYTLAENAEELTSTIKNLVASKTDLILCFGSSGISSKDVASHAIDSLLTSRADGVIDASRKYGLDRSQFAMLSNGSAGFIESSFILSLPGSTRGAQESMDYLFPFLFHVLGRND